jgi:hypothetical protein
LAQVKPSVIVSYYYYKSGSGPKLPVLKGLDVLLNLRVIFNSAPFL